MLIVGNVLVSEELIDKCFCCDLAQCKGECCVDGDLGAPVAPDEVAELEEYYPDYQKYMTEEGESDSLLINESCSVVSQCLRPHGL